MSDEVAYTLQSKLFASGVRFGPEPDNASMWMLPFWDTSGPMYSPFPVGWPLLLGVGEFAHVASAVNPLLVGVVPWLLYRIGRKVGGADLGVRAAMVGALSPGLLLLGASRMAHTSVLVALGTVMVIVLENRWTRRRVVLGGVAVAYVVLARPFDAALLGAPLVIWGLIKGGRNIGPLWIGIPVLAGAFVLFDNWMLTGSPTRFPMQDWYDAWQGRVGCNSLGFGSDVGCAPTLGDLGHTPAKAVALGREAWVRFDGLLLGVPGGTILALVGAWRMRARRGAMWVVLIALGYALYWSPGRAYGARFWHPMYLAVPIAVAAVLRSVPIAWAGLGLVVLSALGFRAVLPELRNDYWCVDGALKERLESRGIQHGVVFLQSDGRRPMAWPNLGVDRFQCDPMLEAGDAWSMADPTRVSGGLQFRHALRDADDTEVFMLRHHPGEPAYLVRYDVKRDVRAIDFLGVFERR